MRDNNLEMLVTTLLALPQMQTLWDVHDRGVPVFAHTVDVTLLCLEHFSATREDAPTLDVRVVTLGSLLHDLSKASARAAAVCSHSHIMTYYPEVAASEAQTVLREALSQAGQDMSDEDLQAILHVVVSHHGPWGKIAPRTPEAHLVHKCDLYSAMNHRLAPIDANDILPYLDEGRKWRTISALLGVGNAVLRQRIADACHAELAENWMELLQIWRRRGHVLTGNAERRRQLERVKFVIQSAKHVPDSVIEALYVI